MGDFMFRTKRGLTLIEVIVSIALLGIIAISFLPSIANQFSFLVETRTNITQRAFAIQDDMETSIQEAIEALRNGAIAEDDWTDFEITDKISVKLFEDDFSGYTYRVYPSAYKVEVSDGGNKKLVTLVGDKRLPELPVPIIETVSRVFIKEGSESPSTHEYYNYTDLRIMAKSNMTSNPQNSFNRYRTDWYVSKPGFIIPVQDISIIDEDNDFGRIYPSFPDDYDAIPIYSELGSGYSYISSTERRISVELKNNIVNKYPGKHILYSITPFAKSLKKGNTASLLPVYVYGPDVTDNLALHLDASTINMSDKINTSSTILEEDGEYYIRNWKNSRPSVRTESSNSFKASQSTKEYMPVLIKDTILLKPEIPFQAVEVGGATTYSVWGRALGNKSSATSVTDSNYNLQLKDASNQIELSSVPDDWLLVHAKSTASSGMFMEVKSLKKNSTYADSISGIGTIDINDININFNGLEIAEILLYKADMNSEIIDDIKDYLTNKYNPS